MRVSRCSIATLLLLSSALVVAAQNRSQPTEPVAWGVLSGNASCVIFAEGHKTSGRFYGVAITTKTVGKLTVIESHDYSFPDKEVLETQENMDRMTQTAEKDHVKFVKIPEKYSADLLEKARAVCRAGAQ